MKTPRCKYCDKKIAYAPLIGMWYHRKTRTPMCETTRAEPR